MQACQRRIILLPHPGQPGIGQMPARIGNGRHVVDDITERGGLDKQNLSHRWGGFLQAPTFPWERGRLARSFFLRCGRDARAPRKVGRGWVALTHRVEVCHPAPTPSPLTPSPLTLISTPPATPMGT